MSPEIGAGTTLIVAEAPGATEAEQGRPLVGSSGGWLRGRYDEERKAWSGGLLGRAGLRDVECSKLNVLQCRPPDNIFPTDPEARKYISLPEAQRVVSHCIENHVLPVVRGRDWKRIILLGEKALRALTGKTEGISIWRGSPLPLVDGEEPVCIPTYHPSFISRAQHLIPAVISDLKKSLIVPPEQYLTHPSIEEVCAFDATSFAFDIETIRETGEITMVGLSSRNFSAMCVPFGGAYVEQLKRIFRNAEEAIGHNCLQFDLPRLRDNGVTLRPGVQVWDTMLMQHLLQPDLPHDLGFVGSIFTNKPAWKHLSGDDEALYCCRDTDVTLQCQRQLKPLLAAHGLTELYNRVQVPLARICALMHRTGITLDPARIGAVRDKLAQEMKDEEAILPVHLRTSEVACRKRIPAPPGSLSEKTGKPIKFLMVPSTFTEVPWRSPQAVGRYLYEELALPVQLHPKTKQPSTGKIALDWLHRRAARGDLKATDKRPLPGGLAGILAALRSLRVKDEMLTTFAQEEMLSAQRIHSSFNVHGTATGRLSSSDPNLQNIPPAARFIYVPSHPDWALLEVDFSSLENRLSAWFAHDTDRLGRLAVPGFNEHKFVASAFFSIPYEEIDKDDHRESPYKIAKTINHGCDGGMGPRKIANMEDMDFVEVTKFVKKWKQLNAKTVSWQENIAKQAKADGLLTNPFGRKRWFYTDSYYTEAVRTPAQSTGADICFRVMLGLMWERIGLPEERLEGIVRVRHPLPHPCQLLLQVHDSLLFEGPRPLLEESVALIRAVAEQPWPELRNFNIPVEFKLGLPGASWGELEAYKP